MLVDAGVKLGPDIVACVSVTASNRMASSPCRIMKNQNKFTFVIFSLVTKGRGYDERQNACRQANGRPVEAQVVDEERFAAQPGPDGRRFVHQHCAQRRAQVCIESLEPYGWYHVIVG